MNNKIELGFIYYLQNPITGEIFYVGATQTSLKNRLKVHYQHLREFERGLRGVNKRYTYLQNLKPNKATIHLLEIVTDGNLEEKEIYYIKFFRNLNPNLTNMTDGGKGKCTSKYYTEKQMEEHSQKLKKSLKGKPKSLAFSLNLSEKRKGKGNTMAKEFKDFIICFKDEVPIKMFKYGFEINTFVNNKHAYGNVHKWIDTHVKPYGYMWKHFSKCNKEIQDIVQFDYESNQ